MDKKLKKIALKMIPLLKGYSLFECLAILESVKYIITKNRENGVN